LALLIIRILSSPADDVLSDDTAFRIELYIFSFLLSHKNGLDEPEVNCSDDFLFAGLEEGKLDVGEGNIDDFTLNSAVPESIQVAFQRSFGLLLANARPGVQLTENGPFSFVNVYLLLLDDVFLGVLLTELQPDLLLQGLHLLLKLSNPCQVLTSEHYFLDEDGGLDVLGEIKSGDAVGEVEVEPE
jgi:hypothetical protein